MSTPVSIQTSSRDSTQPHLIEKVGLHFMRYSLVVVLIWIGGMKSTSYEAAAIEPFVENSPLMSFFHQSLGIRNLSSLVGLVEVIIALMIASRHVFPKTSALGSILATGVFLSTLTFILSTPGAFEASEGGFPAISITGQFLLKDLVLLGASILTCGEAMINRE